MASPVASFLNLFLDGFIYGAECLTLRQDGTPIWIFLKKQTQSQKNLETIFYMVDVEISNKPKICRNLAYFFQLVGRQEFFKFVGYLKFPNQPYKEWCLGWLFSDWKK